MTDTLTPEDVKNALRAANLDTEIRFFESTTATSQQAADNIGCELGQIVKSLCFMINDEQPVLVLASGDRRVDERKLAVLYDVGRKKVRAANAEQCAAIFGYAPGGVPPLGHRTAGIPVYVDDSLKRFTRVYAAGGAHNAIFPVELADLVRATGGQFTDVKRDD